MEEQSPNKLTKTTALVVELISLLVQGGIRTIPHPVKEELTFKVFLEWLLKNAKIDYKALGIDIADLDIESLMHVLEEQFYCGDQHFKCLYMTNNPKIDFDPELRPLRDSLLKTILRIQNPNSD